MYRLPIIVLTFGAIVGFASAAHHGMQSRHEAFERHVADVCADAALRARPSAPR
ncbi:MAG TPA: hypothetical protein VH062_20620 [Polyangiaceae bacterium]|jgi:hypothetical protein|nr:hypothetical protein [Polyangiaceae bacterium]